MQELDSGECIEQTVSTNTPVVYIQQGVAVGASGYPPFPSPLYGIDNPDVSQFYDTPEVSGLSFINWPIRWNYRKTSTTNQGLAPPTYPA